MNNALQKSSVSDLFVAVLISEVGTSRLEALRDRFLDELDLPGTVKQELFESLEHSLLLLSQVYPGDMDGGSEAGGLGEKTIKHLGAKDLEFLSDNKMYLDADDLLHLTLLREARVGDLNTALTFISERVSQTAGNEAKLALAESRDMLTTYASDLAFARYLRAHMDPDLQGPTAREVRSERAAHTDRAGGRLGGLLAALLSLGGPLGGRSLEDMLRGPSLEDLLPKDVTIGDVWRMQNIPFGLPTDIEDFLRRHDPKAKIVKMDTVRATPLIMIETEESMRKMGAASTKLILQGAVSRSDGALVARLFELSRAQIVRDFGTVAEARTQTKAWLGTAAQPVAVPVEEGEFIEPTPNCDCPRCATIKMLADMGMKINRQTGMPVSV